MELSEVSALLGLVDWAGECAFHGDDKGSGKQVEICEFIYDLSLELGHYCFYLILLANASHMVEPKVKE